MLLHGRLRMHNVHAERQRSTKGEASGLTTVLAARMAGPVSLSLTSRKGIPLQMSRRLMMRNASLCIIGS